MGESERPVVLVAIEPRCYREAIGSMLAILRPHLDVRITEPDAVPSEAERASPRVVISGLPPPPAGERDGTAWVRIVFPAEPGTWIAVGDGPLENHPDLDIERLLGIVDDLGGTAPGTALS